MPAPSAAARAIALPFALIVACILGASTLAAQPTPQPSTVRRDTSQAGLVRVYLDCQTNGCDRDFFVQELRWVNIVRERLEADVHLLVTSLGTGSGGTEYTVNAIGQRRWVGRSDTLVTAVEPASPQDVRRRELLRVFGLLLAQYAAQTAESPLLSITYRPPAARASQSPDAVNDPWDFWVFNLSANAYSSGEKRQRFLDSYWSTSANRYTDEWKIRINSNLSYSDSWFELSDGTRFTNILRQYGGNVLVGRSVTPKLSVGGQMTGQRADFYNYDSNIRAAAAIEYDFIPYREYTRKSVILLYTVGATFNNYQDTTIYGRVSETRPHQTAQLQVRARQPWGNITGSLYGAQFLHDLNRYNYGISGSADLRLVKGLQLNFSGNFGKVADQLYLRRGSLDDTEVVARIRALETNYRYYFSAGVSYTFGSIYSTIVNPRFNLLGSGGGFFF
jgi:hypothetical protein